MEEAMMEAAMTPRKLWFAQREEACKRLEVLERLGLHVNVRAEFEREGRLNYSERVALGMSAMGAIYWMDGPSAVSCGGRPFADVVREFEERSGALVYHATHEVLAFGEILDLFYVTKHVEQWEQDRADLEEGYAFVNAVNLSEASMSDLGTIGFTVSGGGLLRTA